MQKLFKSYRGNEPYIFVCHSHADAHAVYPELTRLKNEGFNIWYDEGIEPGLSWREEIAVAVSECSLFLIFISPKSVASTFCIQELNHALSYERKVLAVHLEETHLPPGVELSLNDKQAIIKDDYVEADFQKKLYDGLNSYLFEISSAEEAQPVSLVGGDSSIAILPFTNRGDSNDGVYLSEGIADELIHGMSHFKNLRIVSGFAFRNQNLDVRNIGRKFKVQSVLDGSVQQSGDRIRINVRLTDTSDGSMIWSQRYDQHLKDIFEIQDNVASAVLKALEVSLSVSDEPTIEIGTQSIDAYDAYLLGSYEKRKDQRSSHEKAIEYFTQATKIDSNFSRAFYQLGICYWEMTVYLGLDSEIIQNAERAFEKARELKHIPNVPWVHVERRLHPEFRPSQRELAVEALDLIKNRRTDWRNFEYAQLGRCLGSAGFYQASFDYLSKYTTDIHEISSKMESIENDTRSLLPVLNRFGEAIKLLTIQLESQPDDLLARQNRAMLFSRTSLFGKAEEDIRLLPGTSQTDFVTFYHLYWQDRLQDARKLFEKILLDDKLPLRFMFWGCSMMGQIEQSIENMELSATRGAPIFNIRVLLNSAISREKVAELEAHSRYQRFLERCGIDANWCAELSDLVNDVTETTGIHVSPYG